MKTSSLAWPNMINVAQNKIDVLEDETSVVSRDRLLFLTQPTEIYNEPNQGVGLKEYLWHYNDDNTRALIKDKIKDQLRLHEPQCNPENTQFRDGLLFTESKEERVTPDYEKLKMTVAVETKFTKTVEVEI